MTEIKCIIFDVGGVLVSERIEVVWDDLNRKVGKEVFKRTPIGMRLAKGKISVNDYYAYMARKAGVPAAKLHKMALKEYLNAMRINTATIKLAKKLKRNGYRVSIISNTTEDNKIINMKRAVYSGFDPVILSCDVGCMKPHKKIFDIFLKKTGMKPHNCVFIDDREEYFHYPKKIGIKIIHFKNNRQVTAELGKLGVKI